MSVGYAFEEAGVPAGLTPGTLDTATVVRTANARIPWGVRLAVFWVLLVILLAIFANVLPIASPYANISGLPVPPFRRWPEFLGTDQLGRSEISRLIYGARVSLAVSGIATAAGMTIGVLLALLSVATRTLDWIIGVIIDSALAFPGIILILALAAALTPGPVPLVIGLTVFAVPAFARLARGNAKVIMAREHVSAAKVAGAPTRRWLVREVLPGVMRPVLPYALVLLAVLMVAEASVSFLGVGVVPPQPSWGGMISDGETQLSIHPEQVLIPAAVLFLTVFSITVIGRWLRTKIAESQAKL